MISKLVQKLGSGLRHFRRDQTGSATMDFVLMFPAVMLIFTSSYESGVLSTRHVMLERGLDTAVRDVRLGKIQSPDPEELHDLLVQRVCDVASIIPNCTENVRLEMIQRDPRNWVAPPNDVMCVDRAQVGPPALNFNPGLNNELMVLRACALFDPMIPTTGLGKEIPKESGGAYALVATSAYVMEPFQK